MALPAAMAAVNFPASIASPALGLVFGNASSFLEAQLAALETNSTGKVISAPKVVTMDGKKAIIKQGQEIPYITRTVNAQGGETVTVTFKEAVLKLEVTPRITEQGKISMEILAGNEVADWKNTVEGNPPINKNSVDSTVVIDDGDTVVIGGVLRDQEDKTVDGVPWFQSIPVLGWLFKTVNIQNEKRQLLVFITPKVISDGVLKDSAGKISN
jgi:type IV pilus assembly protein PilQ